MLTLKTTKEVATEIASFVKQARLSRKLTQEGLAERAGVSLASYRRFERTGLISLDGYLKVLTVLDGLDAILEANKGLSKKYNSIDDVLKRVKTKDLKKRGVRS